MFTKSKAGLMALTMAMMAGLAPMPAQAGFLGQVLDSLVRSDTIVSDPSDNPEVQQEKEYYDQAEQDEIDYHSRDSRAESDYYNSFNR